MKDNFVIHLSFYEAVTMLTDEQAGCLFKALMDYAKNGSVIEASDPLVSFAFRAMSAQINASNKKYADKCEQNRQNILKRYTNTGNSNDGRHELPSNTDVYETYERIPIDREIDKIDKIERKKERKNNIAEDKSSVSSHDDSSEVMRYWNESIEAHMSDNAVTSAFLNGKNRDSKIFTFDQLFAPIMFGKTLEGNFNDAPSRPSEVAKLIEDNKVVVDKEESAKERFIQMIAIYKGNPKSMAVAPLLDAYKNGTLKSLGIDFEP